MIDPPSLAGFALAFIAVAWLGSVVLCGAVLLARRRLMRLGPAVERTAAATALGLAPLAAAMAVAVVGAHSLAPSWFGAIDHCSSHGHHPHLCLVHGGAWAEQSWAVVVLSMFGGILAIRLARRGLGSWKAGRALRRLERVSEIAPEGFHVAPAGRAFCFATGLRRPRIFISTAARSMLNDDELRAVLAHERAHIEQADLWRQRALDAAALLGAPLLAARVLALWRGATERLCDQRAAGEVSLTAVASALVAMSRMAPAGTAGLSFGGSAAVVERVEALLAERPSGHEAARRLARARRILLALAGAALLIFADPLHHLLETLLGVL